MTTTETHVWITSRPTEIARKLGYVFVAIWVAYGKGIYLNYRSSRGSRTDELGERKAAGAF